MSLEAFFETVVRILDECATPYMLTGSLAAAYYGASRATQDIDLVIEASAAALDRLVERLTAEGLYVSREAAHGALRSRGQFNAIDPEEGWKLDLIIRKDRPFSREEFSRRQRGRLLGIETWLPTIEDLILAKLEWSQLGDSDLQRRDVALLAQTGWDSLDRVYLERWASALSLQTEWRRLTRRLAAPGHTGDRQTGDGQTGDGRSGSRA